MLAALTSIALKRVARFVALSVITIALVNCGNAADLPLPINAAQRTKKPPATKTRLQLFKEFLDWKKTQPPK